MKLLTVLYGGVWEMKDETVYYDGDITSKAFVIDDGVQIEDIKKKIIDRFKINVQASELQLSHLHPSLKLARPYVVEGDGDLDSFIAINESPNVSWSLPLYVSLSDRRINNERQMMTVAEISEDEEAVDDSAMPFDDAIVTNCNQYAQQSGKDFLHVGQCFNTKEDVKTAMQNLAIRENFGYKVYKSTPDLYKLRCVDENCKWRFRAAMLKGTLNFEIRKFNDNHTCSADVRCANHCIPTYKTVGEQIKTKYLAGVKHGPNPKSIQNDMRNEYSQEVSYWKAWKAKEWAQNMIRGTPESNYRLLPSYCFVLKEVNPGTYTNYSIGDDNRFKYAFIAIGASIKGFNYIRKVIMVDGTNLHGKYEGNLMIATTQDANNEIYPLAFAIVDSESDDSWTWFFEQLKNVIPSTENLVFVSDRHKSIVKGVEKVYNTANHVVCTRYLKENLKSLFKKKGTHRLFTQASESYTKIEFEEYFQRLCNMDSEMGDYLIRADLEKWARAHCKGDRYNIMTTFNSESINAVLKEARSYQLVALLEYIRELLSSWFYKRRELVEENNNKLPPRVRSVVEERYNESKRYEVRLLNEMQFEVVGGKFAGVVDLSNKTCSCRVFDLDHIPCVHAIAAIQKVKGNINDFVSMYYLHSTWKKSYDETIYPVPVKSEWIVPEDIMSIACYPPHVKKQSGRPRKRRYLSEDENRRTVIKNTRKSFKCGKCGNAGHNRKTCKYSASSSKNNIMQAD